MGQYKYITVEEFCFSHGVTTQFIIQLHDFGLIEVVTKEDMEYIQYEELPKVEKIVRLHSDLNINLEGIEVIQDLLDRIAHMQGQIITLKNKLQVYE